MHVDIYSEQDEIKIPCIIDQESNYPIVYRAGYRTPIIIIWILHYLSILLGVRP